MFRPSDCLQDDEGHPHSESESQLLATGTRIRQGRYGGVEPGSRDLIATVDLPRNDPIWIVMKCARCSKLLQIELRAKASPRFAEGWYAAVLGNPRAADNHQSPGD